MERIAAVLVVLVALGLIGLTVFGPKSQVDNTNTVFDKEAVITLVQGNQLQPDRIQMSAGRVKITVRNTTTILHQIEIYDPVEDRVLQSLNSIKARDGEESMWVELVRGRRYEIYDPTWRNKGMEGVLIAR